MTPAQALIFYAISGLVLFFTTFVSWRDSGFLYDLFISFGLVWFFWLAWIIVGGILAAAFLFENPWAKRFIRGFSEHNYKEK